MQLDPITAARVTRAVNHVGETAVAAMNAPDLEAMKAALNKAWFAIHDAQVAINEADRLTRQAALAKLENVA